MVDTQWLIWLVPGVAVFSPLIGLATLLYLHKFFESAAAQQQILTREKFRVQLSLMYGVFIALGHAILIIGVQGLQVLHEAWGYVLLRLAGTSVLCALGLYVGLKWGAHSIKGL